METPLGVQKRCYWGNNLSITLGRFSSFNKFLLKKKEKEKRRRRIKKKERKKKFQNILKGYKSGINPVSIKEYAIEDDIIGNWKARGILHHDLILPWKVKKKKKKLGKKGLSKQWL